MAIEAPSYAAAILAELRRLDELREYVLAGDAAELYDLHVALSDVARETAVLVRAVEENIHDAALADERYDSTKGVLAIDGLPPIRPHVTDESESFDSESLLGKVLDVALLDKPTGEVLLSPEHRAKLTADLTATLPITGSLGWRKRGLSKVLGGRAAWREFHDSKPGRKTFRAD